MFSLSGHEHSQERHAIYHFMLEHMPDDQRFMTTQRLCQDVLGMWLRKHLLTHYDIV